MREAENEKKWKERPTLVCRVECTFFVASVGPVVSRRRAGHALRWCRMW